MMPEGLLDTLERDEVLDLVAYLLSRGDRKTRCSAARVGRGGHAGPLGPSSRR